MEDFWKNKKFNLIIARYNELGLKSRRVRSRMERRLVEYIEELCEKEDLELISSTRRWGRLIFKFPPKKIHKALQVFRYAIGLHSFSPGFVVDSEFDVISKEAVSFAKEYINDSDSFAVRANRVKPYSKTSMEIEREIGANIIEDFNKNKKNLTVNLRNPDKTVFLDIRDSRAYIFPKMISTIWGGNPIEQDKPMLSLWDGSFGEAAATQLMLRRGSVIVPVVILPVKKEIPQMYESDSFWIKSEEIFFKLKKISRHLPDPIKVINLNVDPLVEFLQNTISGSDDFKEFFTYSKLILLEKLKNNLNFDKIMKYDGKSLWFKGMITPFRLKNLKILYFGQKFNLTNFMPIIGFSKKSVNIIEDRINKLDIFNTQEEFTVANVILDKINFEKKEITSNLNKQSYKTNQQIDKISKFFEKPGINEILEEILKMKKITEITKKIL